MNDSKIEIISSDDKAKIEHIHIAILGLGGLGGYLLEYALRLYLFKRITVIDYDSFEKSNLNRQVISSEKNIGHKKIDEARKRVSEINSQCSIKYFDELFDESNAYLVLQNVDIVLDAFDNIEGRIIARNTCDDLNIPFIYGSVYSFYGMVSTIMPKNKTLSVIYSNYKEHFDIKKDTFSFIPPLVASIQMSEAIKLILGKGDILENKILTINTLQNKYTTLSIF